MGYFLPALTLAHLALAAAEIFARAAALILRFLVTVAVAGLPLATVLLPSKWVNSLWRFSILSLMLAACRSCFDVN